MRPITLTAAAGPRSSELDGPLQGGSRFWSPAPPIDPARFDAGQHRAQVEANQAAQRVALADCEAALQAAFREVADAPVVRGSLAAQHAQVAAAERSLSLGDTSDRLRASSQLELLDAQRQLAAALQGLVTLRQAGAG